MAAVISTLASTKFKPFAAQFTNHSEASTQGLGFKPFAAQFTHHSKASSQGLDFGIRPAGWYIKLSSLESPCDCSSIGERRDVILMTKPKPKGKPA